MHAILHLSQHVKHSELIFPVTSSPLICDGFLTTSLTRCNIVSVFSVLSAHIKSTRMSWDALATGSI